MKSATGGAIACMACLAWCGAAAGDVFKLKPVADNTIMFDFYNQPDLLSNGVGDGVFCGRTLVHRDIQHRGLLKFDLSGVPCGATITGVQLTMTVVAAPRYQPTFAIELHRVTSAWGEGASNSFGGAGAPSEAADANWYERLHPGVMWNQVGGDFDTTVSASTLVPAELVTVNWTGSQMINDVHAWMADGSTNFGWMLLGNESVTGTVRKFASREYATSSARPELRVEFTRATPLEIVAQPQAGLACRTGGAAFSMAASGSLPQTYEWQMESGVGNWVTLNDAGVSIECARGGSAAAFARPQNGSSAIIGVSGCSDGGVYRIRCIVRTQCEQLTTDPTTLTVCAADFNCDASVDFFDYLDFVDAFTSGAGDFNGDGVVDFFDYLDFVDAFTRDC